MWTCTQRWYLDESGAATQEESETTTLLCGAWDRIPQEQAEALGLCDAQGTPIEQPAAKRSRKAVKQDE